MGSVKREYSLYDYDFNITTRTLRETMNYLPSMKSKTMTMNLVKYAFLELKSTFIEGRELNCKLIIQKICNLMDTYTTRIAKQDFKLSYTLNISGGFHYNLNRTCVDGNNTFEFDTIQIGIGVVYYGHYSNCVRTILINPTQQVKYNYNFLQAIQRVIIYNLRDGVDLNKVYESAISFAKTVNPYLEEHLEKIFGCIVDPELIDDFIICSNAKSTAKYGMIFVTNINLIGLEEGGKCYNLRHINTILVRKGEPAELLTNTLQTQNVIFYINKHSGLVNSS